MLNKHKTSILYLVLLCTIFAMLIIDFNYKIELLHQPDNLIDFFMYSFINTKYKGQIAYLQEEYLFPIIRLSGILVVMYLFVAEPIYVSGRKYKTMALAFYKSRKKLYKKYVKAVLIRSICAPVFIIGVSTIFILIYPDHLVSSYNE